VFKIYFNFLELKISSGILSLPNSFYAPKLALISAAFKLQDDNEN